MIHSEERMSDQFSSIDAAIRAFRDGKIVIVVDVSVVVIVVLVARAVKSYSNPFLALLIVSPFASSVVQ